MTESRFLTGSAIQFEVARLMQSPRPANLAVAFWGNKATKETGIATRAAGQTQVLCHLFSGACNPREIQRMLDAGVQVKTLDGMHAKVWVAGDCAIVGSTNASSNGLGLGLDAGKGVVNEEAAVLVEDAAFANGIRTWFATLWNDSRAIEVSKAEIEDATPMWEQNQARPQRPTTRTIMKALASKRAEKLFQNVHVVAYRPGELSAEALETFDKVKASYSDAALERYGEALPLYEDDGSWRIGAGDIVIDFHCASRRSRPVLDGIWQVRPTWGFQPFEKKGVLGARLILVNELFHIGGYRLPKSERTELARLVRARIKATDQVLGEGEYLDEPLLDLWRARSAG